MTTDAAGLLDGPRGRLLCLELAARLSSDVREAMHDLAYNADVFAGASIVRFGLDEDGRSFQTSDPVTPRFPLDELAARIGALGRRGPAAGDIAEALQRAVDLAAYWQPPRGEEIVAAEPVVRAALRPLAVAVAGHRSTQWWRRERTAEQWAIEWDPVGDGAPFDPVGQTPAQWSAETRREEADAERTRPRDPAAPYGGSWWSISWRAPHSAGTMPDAVPAGIALVEDSLGWERAVAIPVRGAGRTLEIRDAEDWVRLCAQFPLEVTASRRQDWFRTTGRAGTWVIPDWARVADQWDTVHLSVWAYLTAAGRALPVDDDRASVIAGFGPDQTYWLTGRVREIEGPRVHWRAVEPGPDTGPSWVRAG